MSYSKVQIPTEVYHLTKKEKLDSILADKRIRRFGDTECWFCRDIPDMLRYMEYTVLNEGAPYIGVGGRMMYYPAFDPSEHVLLRIVPQKWEDKWYQWNQVVPQNASAETKAQAAEFLSLKVGYRGGLRFSKCEVIELESILAEYLTQEETSPELVI